MNLWRALLITAALGTLALIGLTLALAQDPANFTWQTDLAAATEKAKADGLPLLLVFR